MEQTEENKLAIFEIKQKFLREIPHHKLILKYIKQLNRKYELVLVEIPSIDKAVLDVDVSSQTIEQFLNEYILINLKRKHQISLALDPQVLRDELVLLMNEEFQLLLKLNTYVLLDEKVDLSAVKMSDSIDAYFILKSIQQLNLQENEIKKYLCDTVKAKEDTGNSLLQVFLRVHKIILHG